MKCAASGDLVADFFCGSGATPVAAHHLNRRFIGCDVGINAIQTTRDRLCDISASFDILRIRDGVRLFRNPAQTEERLFNLISGWQSRKKLKLAEFWDGGVVNPNGAFTPAKYVRIRELLTRKMLDVVLEAAAEKCLKQGWNCWNAYNLTCKTKKTPHGVCGQTLSRIVPFVHAALFKG